MLTLVSFTPLHFATLANWFASEREVVQWGGPWVSFPLDEEQLFDMVEEGLCDPPTRLCWMAREDDKMVGHAQIGLDWRNGNATLSRVAIAPAARGRGLAVPMLSSVIDEAFRLPEIERVELNVYSFNAPALRTYERLGLKREGVRRASALVGSERWDTVIMAVLRPEWVSPLRADSTA